MVLTDYLALMFNQILLSIMSTGTIATSYNVTNIAIAVAWISRHPAKKQTIVGPLMLVV